MEHQLIWKTRDAVFVAAILILAGFLLYSAGTTNGLYICSQNLAQAALELKIKAAEPATFNFTGFGGNLG